MTTAAIAENEKYCTDCGKVILRRAEICPGCGCRQMTVQASCGVPAMPPNTGKIAVLIIGNVLWNGLGNLLIGDRRGWKWGFQNWGLVFISIFTFGIPCILGCIHFSLQGYEFLKSKSNL